MNPDVITEMKGLAKKILADYHKDSAREDDCIALAALVLTTEMKRFERVRR